MSTEKERLSLEILNLLYDCTRVDERGESDSYCAKECHVIYQITLTPDWVVGVDLLEHTLSSGTQHTV